MRYGIMSLALVGGLLAGMVSFAEAADENDRPGQSTARVRVNAEGTIKGDPNAQKSSEIVGMAVKNRQGEDLGQIEDLVIDVPTGKLRYAALSFGGVLGIGDKLFAVPWKALKVQYDREAEEYTVVLNASKERLENAPGFTQDRWPDFGDTQFTSQVDQFYEADVPREARRDAIDRDEP